MKIEVGKFYKTRSGKKAIVDYISSDVTLKWNVVCRIIGETSFSVSLSDGCYNFVGDYHAYDLIEEWKD